ncbi:lymphocyte antigen 75 [Biomphalaria pfeifferi]|uniref:Lymphocyte antigen 75 n=1 Tax=Biomphalaria pfeifferi TaxID=112525 RepID=A0AAD8FLB3_BIOPF|nr:lymphocyte antigen 75 [Biomphalaria pfeifferi]
MLTQTFFKRLDNVLFTNTTTTELCWRNRCSDSFLSCSLACNSDPTCSSYNYNSSLQTCTKNVGDIYTFGGGTLQSSAAIQYVGKIQSDVTDGAWILVYRAQAENNVSAYGVYNNSGYVSDNDLSNLPLSSISKTGDVTSSHYRSRWMNEWPSKISQVKFELYTQGQTVLTLLFNATGSNSTNWFSYSRLIQSPFTDLTWPPAIFSSTGYPNTRRIFCITNATSFIDCTQKSWLLVEDTVDTTCSWTSGATKTFPRFQYSKSSTFTTFSTKTQGLANVLATFIKF